MPCGTSECGRRTQTVPARRPRRRHGAGFDRAAPTADDPDMPSRSWIQRVDRLARAACLAATALIAAGCEMLPDDHALRSTLGASLHRFEGSLHDTVSGLDREFRTGLRDTTRAAVAVPDAVVRRTDRLQHSTRDLVGGSIARAEVAPLRIRDTTLAGVRAETYRGAALTRTLSPSAVGAHLERSLSQFDRQLRAVPSTLRLDRRILPVPEDADSGPDPVPDQRSPSLFERVLRQIPW